MYTFPLQPFLKVKSAIVSYTWKNRNIVHLKSASTSGTLSAGRISGNRGHIFNSTNLKASTGKSSKSGLSTRSGGLGAVTTGSSHLNVHGGDAELLGLSSGIHSGKHGSIGRSLITIGLHLHATGDTAQSLATGKVGDVLMIVANNIIL